MADVSIGGVISSTTTVPRRVQFPIVTSSIDFRLLPRRRRVDLLLFRRPSRRCRRLKSLVRYASTFDNTHGH